MHLLWLTVKFRVTVTHCRRRRGSGRRRKKLTRHQQLVRRRRAASGKGRRGRRSPRMSSEGRKRSALQQL